MSAAIVALLAVIGQISSALGGTEITAVITTLSQIIPALVGEVEDVVPMIKNIIAALQSNTAITPEQQAQLAALDAQCDQAFEAAAVAAQAEDAAADKSAPPDGSTPPAVS